NLEALESPDEIDRAAMPHSGDQYLMSFNPAPIDDVITDANDWLISPELPGIAQTITFYAKALTTQWGNETFEIFYSTTGKAMEDFIKIGATREGTDEWNMFSAELPEGAKYFAIRVTSSNRFAFMLDDISYYSGNAEILGYNIYRDGKLVKTVAPDVVECQDYPEEPGTYSWNVTVQYVAGESNPSNTFTSDVNGSQGVDALTADNTQVWYNVAAKVLNIASKNVIEKVEIYDMQGQLLHIEDAVATCDCHISMAAYSSAVYVVRTHTTDAININRIVVR
ncbi:MAG: choice-of-anchor J domain-containing protein, partial [Bacteroidaceae bacterium]|nr:choice-of-anchor J domain-containing protein [Bacteroidaceae bacterium]